ncbi:tRNA pseudouridine(55) synthase TruB [Methylonatrum kenyense]|uniref:tRNA pseudouridine(55) synthase TruB n=1 Tax=Methylonatrum kenyense TaxID=455253 RepID=UPI0020BE4C65|nr:tRNA pseudouridine(55) synthase TruB [Methylonatrum kenyense]MCK8515927.1 tRNA pseudouridine(55) synthase TruB [Methylonatrum kenyense]
MVKRANRRRVDGILLLDKAVAVSSNRALQQMKHLFQARKAGHTGSLDPLASGLLPICFGEATKISGFLLNADKRYQVVCRLGVTTDSGDADGEIRQRRPVPELERGRIEQALAALRGPILQVPPMVSALKHQGQRLYKLARQGIEVERPPRAVTVHQLRLESRPEPDCLALSVHCSKGTYVRSLVESIGEDLGCGAHVIALRRTALGPFAGESMVTADAMQVLAARGGLAALDRQLLPVEQGLAGWPDVHLAEEAAHFLVQGQAVWTPGLPEPGLVRVFGPTDFLGMGRVGEDGRLQPHRLMRTD